MESTTNNVSPAPKTDELGYIIQQAVALHRMGIACVPLCRPVADGSCTADWHPSPCESGGKRPLVAGYPAMADNLPPVNDIIELFERFYPCNVGLVVPAGMMVIEADSPGADAEIAALMVENGTVPVAPCRERREGRGRAWLFMVDPAWGISRRVHLGQSGAIDVLTLGSILVLPPSVHRTGHRYTWAEAPESWIGLPVLPPGLVALALRGAGVRRSAEADQSESGSEYFTPRVSPRIGFLLSARTNVAQLWEGGGKDRGDTSRSGIDYRLAAVLSMVGIPVHEIAEALGARPESHRNDRGYCFATAIAAAGRRHV